ncbi:hypothetical protein BLNAU_18736 [Blattamonas nauphoetae]|uniref:Uncharacterized protein n=1 Tax=Blattamonas nauphoetae TaxID=2049346 RepID=A0ABQ9X7I5_9EUKA|nr:hypothetical protein BLNAU_18736 [Blattamonas nauphoetae]
MILNILIWAFIVPSCLSQSNDVTHYIDSNVGADIEGCGPAENPCKTLSFAIANCAIEGKSTFLCSGEFTEIEETSIQQPSIVIRTSTAESKPTLTTDSKAPNNTSIFLVSADPFEIDSFTLNLVVSYADLHPVVTVQETGNLILTNCEVKGTTFGLGQIGARFVINGKATFQRCVMKDINVTMQPLIQVAPKAQVVLSESTFSSIRGCKGYTPEFSPLLKADIADEGSVEVVDCIFNACQNQNANGGIFFIKLNSKGTFTVKGRDNKGGIADFTGCTAESTGGCIYAEFDQQEEATMKFDNIEIDPTTHALNGHFLYISIEDAFQFADECLWTGYTEHPIPKMIAGYEQPFQPVDFYQFYQTDIVSPFIVAKNEKYVDGCKCGTTEYPCPTISTVLESYDNETVITVKVDVVDTDVSVVLPNNKDFSLTVEKQEAGKGIFSVVPVINSCAFNMTNGGLTVTEIQFNFILTSKPSPILHIRGEAEATFTKCSVFVNNSGTLFGSLFIMEGSKLTLKELSCSKFTIEKDSLIRYFKGTIDIMGGSIQGVQRSAGNGAILSSIISTNQAISITDTVFDSVKTLNGDGGVCSVDVVQGGSLTIAGTLESHNSKMKFSFCRANKGKDEGFGGCLYVLIDGAESVFTIKNTQFVNGNGLNGYFTYIRTNDVRKMAENTFLNGQLREYPSFYGYIGYSIPDEAPIPILLYSRAKPDKIRFSSSGYDVDVCGHAEFVCRTFEYALQQADTPVQPTVNVDIFETAEFTKNVVLTKKTIMKGEKEGATLVFSSGTTTETENACITCKTDAMIRDFTVQHKSDLAARTLFSLNDGVMEVWRIKFEETPGTTTSKAPIVNLAITNSTVTISSCSFGQAQTSASSHYFTSQFSSNLSPNESEAEPDAVCVWETTGVVLDKCTSNISNVSFTDSPSGALEVKGGSLTFKNPTFARNTPPSATFPGFRKNMFCSDEAKVTISADEGHTPFDTEDPFIQTSNCTVSGLDFDSRKSIWFVPSLSVVMVKKEKKVYNTMFSGSSFFPCGLTIELTSVPKDEKKKALSTFVTIDPEFDSQNLAARIPEKLLKTNDEWRVGLAVVVDEKVLARSATSVLRNKRAMSGGAIAAVVIVPVVVVLAVVAAIAVFLVCRQRRKKNGTFFNKM